MPNEIITIIGNDIIVPQYVLDTIKAYKKAEAEYKTMEKKLKAELTKAMRESGVDKFTSPDGVTITYYPESTTTMVAVERLKNDGLYDKYRLEVPKSDYIKISVKKGE